MKNYEKPVVLVNEELAEGVYAASGCFEAKINEVQGPSVGFEKYVYQVDAVHNATHTCPKQKCTITFAQPVNVETCNAAMYEILDGGCTVIMYREDMCNFTQEIGFGDFTITDPGYKPTVVSIEVEDIFE